MKSVINSKTGEFKYATMIEVDLLDGEILVNDSPNDEVKPYWDFVNQKFYETATEEEIQQAKYEGESI